MTHDLLEFLRLCLDEEQHEAEAALKQTTTTRRMIQGRMVEDTVQPPEWRRSAWSPKRVLAEVDAKRRMLDEFDQALAQSRELKGTPHSIEGAVRVLTSLRFLKLLALPYADHPDYREAWRP